MYWPHLHFVLDWKFFPTLTYSNGLGNKCKQVGVGPPTPLWLWQRHSYVANTVGIYWSVFVTLHCECVMPTDWVEKLWLWKRERCAMAGTSEGVGNITSSSAYIYTQCELASCSTVYMPMPISLNVIFIRFMLLLFSCHLTDLWIGLP